MSDESLEANAETADEAARTDAYRVNLPMFEGPLDLLLHLIQKHELNILDIPIGFIAQKYVEYIDLMDVMSIDLASEYLVMAATLVHLKSRSLLPADPHPGEDDALEEEEEDPRTELIRRLLEYQKYKQAAESLAERPLMGRDVFPRGTTIEVSSEPAPLAQLSMFKLVDAFEAVLKRAKRVVEHEVDFERVTITDRIGHISELLRLRGMLRFEELFDADVSRAEMIVTFLALLEMTKLRMTRLRQDRPLDPIYVELAVIEEGEFAASETHALEATPEDDSSSELGDLSDSALVERSSWEEIERLAAADLDLGGGLDDLDGEELATEATALEEATSDEASENAADSSGDAAAFEAAAGERIMLDALLNDEEVLTELAGTDGETDVTFLEASTSSEEQPGVIPTSAEHGLATATERGAMESELGSNAAFESPEAPQSAEAVREAVFVLGAETVRDVELLTAFETPTVEGPALLAESATWVAETVRGTELTHAPADEAEIETAELSASALEPEPARDSVFAELQDDTGKAEEELSGGSSERQQTHTSTDSDTSSASEADADQERADNPVAATVPEARSASGAELDSQDTDDIPAEPDSRHTD